MFKSRLSTPTLLRPLDRYRLPATLALLATLVLPAAVAAPTHTGIVSIDGRLCVGEDCDEFVPVPIEAIKIRQNNAWIRVEDTSAIGVTHPSGDWQIKFNDSTTLASGGTSYFGIEDRGDDGSNTVMPFRIDAGAPTNSIRVDQSGRVGLGTATPTEAVDVLQDGAARFQLSTFSSVGSDAAQFIQRRARGNQAAPAPVQSGDNIGLFSFRGMRPNGLFSGSKAAITAQATQNWQNSQNGTSIKFSTTQNGTATLSTVMEITHDKKVKINGTDLNVPDYVFEDEYDLMPLVDLKAYIKQHKHLPDMAGAEQVKTEGLDLGGSQMALLQKIEELTLYTLQQEARIVRQQTEIDELREFNDRLPERNQQITALNEEVIQLRVLVNRLAAKDQLAPVN